jgi:hypothetical protein
MSTSSAPPFPHVRVARMTGEGVASDFLFFLHYFFFEECFFLHFFFAGADAPDAAPAASAIVTARASAARMHTTRIPLFPLIASP